MTHVSGEFKNYDTPPSAFKPLISNKVVFSLHFNSHLSSCALLNTEQQQNRIIIIILLLLITFNYDGKKFYNNFFKAVDTMQQRQKGVRGVFSQCNKFNYKEPRDTLQRT